MNCKGQETKSITNYEGLVGTIKMTAQEGALPSAYAAVVPQPNVYLGPAYAVVGEPKIVGTLQGSWHHQSFSPQESSKLWDKSMKAMGIEVFGDFEVVAEEETSAEGEAVVDVVEGEIAEAINHATAEE